MGWALRARPPPASLVHKSHTSRTFFSPVSKKFVYLQPKINPKKHNKMAKIYGLFGSMTGKLADTVMSVRNGEQIARKYQPVVYNPSTTAQVANRAKMKLMSQLSAVFGPYIAMPRMGSVSSRNMFVKTNYGAATYAGSQADVTLTSIKLTRSAVGLPAVTASRDGFNVTMGLAGGNFPVVDRVVYVVAIKGDDKSLRVLTSQVVSTPGAQNKYEATISLANQNDHIVIFAYGVRDNTDSARAIFGDLQVLTAETVAKVVVTRGLTSEDITLTETQAVASDPA